MPAAPSLTEEPGAIAIARSIASGKTSARDTTEAAIARIEALDGTINAVVVRDFKRARQAADAADKALESGKTAPLLGVPITIKESFDIAGLPTTWGSPAAREHVAQEDAQVVKRLKTAGAIFLGKTNVPPMLADWQADNPIYGRTHNPHDLTRSPGGSSGGAAAALASGMVPLEYGSDIGGSIRIPATFCGVWGHKTSFGLVSGEGHFIPGLDGADPALAVVGPLARNHEDLALALELTIDRPLERRSKPLKDLNVLMLNEYPNAAIASGVTDMLEGIEEKLGSAGTKVSRSSALVPDLEAQQSDYMKMLAIAMSGGAPGPDGQRASVREWFDLLDAQARNARQWRQLFEEFDVVLAPPAGIVAFKHIVNVEMRNRTLEINGKEEVFADQFAWAGLVTFPGLPATATPVGTVDGLPAGVQVIGGMWRDLDTIEAAAAIHRLCAHG